MCSSTDGFELAGPVAIQRGLHSPVRSDKPRTSDFYDSCVVSGIGSSQPFLVSQSCWKMIFSSKTVGASKPMGSKIREEIYRTLRIVGCPISSTALIIAMGSNEKVSVSVSHLTQESYLVR